MKINKSILALPITLLAISGCSNQPDNMSIADVGPINSKGRVTMTAEQLKNATENGATFYEDEASPAAILTDAEYNAAKADTNSILSLVGLDTSGDDVVSIVRTGSLKTNLSRILHENHWNALAYEGADYFVGKAFVVRGDSVEAVLHKIIEDLPVSACIDPKNKSITLIQREI